MRKNQYYKRRTQAYFAVFALTVILFLLLILLFFTIIARKDATNPNNDASTTLPEQSESEPIETPPPPADSESGSNIEQETDPNSTETDAPETGLTMEQILQLPNEADGWAFGNNLDEENRPKSATRAQDQYGKYSADFIRLADEKAIYLTFDCGYENGYTGRILDVLQQHSVKAVFFVTGYFVRTEPELVRRMIDEGHILGNHSMNHPSGGLPSLTPEKQLKELNDLHEYVKEHFDYEMTLFRYPAGEYSEQSLALIQSLGYRSVFWSYAYADWDPDNQPDPEKSLNKLVTRIHSGAIYLLHAVSATNTSILGDFITQAQQLGYTIARYH